MNNEANSADDQPFQINSAERANWLVRKIVEARAYGERVRAWATREQRRAEREEEQLLRLFGQQLEEWTKGELAAFKGRRKSIRLPGGVVGYRRVGMKIVIVDPAAVLKWAREQCPDAIIRSERISTSAIRIHMKETGELPDKGARVEGERNQFFVR